MEFSENKDRYSWQKLSVKATTQDGYDLWVDAETHIVTSIVADGMRACFRLTPAETRAYAAALIRAADALEG